VLADLIHDAALKNSTRRWYVGIAAVALLWAVANCVYVYIGLGGERAFRIESAVFILAGLLAPLVFWQVPGAALAGPTLGEPERLATTQDRILMAAAVGLWLVTMAPLVSFPFLSDDFVFLAAYQRWSSVLDFSHFFRPLFALVFFVLTRLGGLSSVPFHVVSLLLHAASSWFVYVLARRLLMRSDAAVLCFALFLLNPLQLEAVVWASGLQELLWTTCVLGGLLVYTGAQTLSPLRIIVTTGLLGAALLSKETAVSSILLLPLADWAFFRMARGRQLGWAYLTFGLLLVAYLLTRTRVASIESTYFVTPGTYFAKQFVGTPYKFFVQPWNLSAAAVPALFPCAAAVAAIALLFLAVVRGSGPALLTGPLVMLVSTLPVYSYFYVAPDLRGARYLYFATFGWALFAAGVITSALPGRRALSGAWIALVLVSFLFLRVNLGPWRTAGEIIGRVESAVREGNPPEQAPQNWLAEYGPGLGMKDGVPQVYKGVYLFVNGYPELRALLKDRD
jgi:hypothetical protein